MNQIKNIEVPFAEWLQKTIPDSYRQYLGRSVSQTRERLQEINNFFPERNIFEVENSNPSAVIDFIKHKTHRKERTNNPDFVTYDTFHSNGIPKAVIGKNHYFRFLEQYFASKVNYWVFQGNPKIYDISNALKNGHLKSWKVAAHKDIIKPGDKIILWQTGEKAGCYALAEVSSEVGKLAEEPLELQYYHSPSTDDGENKTERVKIEITKNLVDNPVLWTDIKDRPEFENFKAGNQGTNFSATEEEYRAILEMAKQPEFFNQREFDLLKETEGKKNNKNDKYLSDAYRDLSIAYRKVEYWMDELQQRVFPQGGVHILKKPTNQANNFDGYLWGKIYPTLEDLESKWLAFTVGLDGSSHFNVKIDTVGLNDNDRLRQDYLNYRGDFDDSKIVSRYSFDDINNWDDLLENSEQDLHVFLKYWNKVKSLKGGEMVNEAEGEYNSFKKHPLNQIMYGPPGTGKTYTTILEAAKIIEGNKEIKYDDALEVFNNNLETKIEFITFHQNYSYEDFIQGLRPDVTQDRLSFNRTDGLFTKIAINALFEFYKVFQKNQREELPDKKPVDINEAYIEFLNHLKIGDEFDTRAGEKVKITGFTDRQNIEFRPLKGIRPYLVSGNRLIKLYKAYPAIDNIQRVSEDIRAVIGGCNASIYYVALREFISFLDDYTADENILEDSDDADFNYEDITYARKKELLASIDLKDLRTVKPNEVPNYVIIIDEINRANISRVFGELITLIESDKRSHGKIPLKVTLPSGEKFIVPSNLYIIGTMNTADKSIALLDIALRRRFEFVPMYPKYDIDEKSYVDYELLENINLEIIKRKGHDFTIGHSYFMGADYSLENTINNKVVPLLLEYFMNDHVEVKKILTNCGIILSDDWPMKYTGLKND